MKDGTNRSDINRIYRNAVKAGPWNMGETLSPEGAALWLDAANAQLLAYEREKSFAFSLEVPLTENDRCILKAMRSLGATTLKLETATTIVEAALYRGDAKKAFTRLIDLGLVASRGSRGGGYWLTYLGERVAAEIQKTDSHTD